jgi:AraC-like DNA-binding protein
MSGFVAMRTLYLKPKVARALPRDCCVINVSSLLKELILYACSLQTLKSTVKWHEHLIAIILHQLEVVQTVPLQLPHLSDPRLVRIAEILIKDPRDSRPLAQLSRVSGASKRSIERLFQQEVGMTFGRWRQQLRLMQAMRLLAEGAKVTHAALESGYSTPSAFISMFRKTLGITPTSYFNEMIGEHSTTTRNRLREKFRQKRSLPAIPGAYDRSRSAEF